MCRIKLRTLAACCGIWGWALSPAPQDTSAQQLLYQDCVLLWDIADPLLELGDLAENLEQFPRSHRFSGRSFKECHKICWDHRTG